MSQVIFTSKKKTFVNFVNLSCEIYPDMCKFHFLFSQAKKSHKFVKLSCKAYFLPFTSHKNNNLSWQSQTNRLSTPWNGKWWICNVITRCSKVGLHFPYSPAPSRKFSNFNNKRGNVFKYLFPYLGLFFAENLGGVHFLLITG